MTNARIQPQKPTATKPPSAYSYPICSMTIPAGARNAKLEPKYAGAFPFVTAIKRRVPTPFMNNTIAGLIPKMKGTSTVAPNMANICWMLSGISRFTGTFSSTWMIFLSFICFSFLEFFPCIEYHLFYLDSTANKDISFTIYRNGIWRDSMFFSVHQETAGDCPAVFWFSGAVEA